MIIIDLQRFSWYSKTLYEKEYIQTVQTLRKKRLMNNTTTIVNVSREGERGWKSFGWPESAGQ